MSNAPNLQESLFQSSDVASFQSAFAAKLKEVESIRTRTFLQEIITRIILTNDEIQIFMSKQRLRISMLGNNRSTPDEATQFQRDETIHMTIKAQLRRGNGEMRVIVPDSQGKDDDKAHPNPALVKAIARSYVWREKLISGEAKSIHSIANEVRVHERYISHILQCAFLAPDLVEVVLEGRQPINLGLDNLLDGRLLRWSDQRHAFHIGRQY